MSLPNSRLFITLLTVALVSLVTSGCGKKENAEEPSTVEVMEKLYHPPADGKIAPQQAEAFAGAFLELLQLDVRYSRKWGDLFSVDSLYLTVSDTSFAKNHPELTARFQELLEAKRRERAKILAKHGLTDSEYDWIGTQLSSPENLEMAELVAAKLKG